MRTLGAMVIIAGFIVAGVFFVIYWVGYTAKRLSNKKGRKEIREEIIDTVSFVAKDKDFHKAFNEEFKWHYVMFAIVIFALIGTALGLG